MKVKLKDCKPGDLVRPNGCLAVVSGIKAPDGFVNVQFANYKGFEKELYSYWADKDVLLVARA